MGKKAGQWFLGLIAAALVSLAIAYAMDGKEFGLLAFAVHVACLGAAGLIVYFVPAIIAADRKHRQANAILLLNFFLGWSLIGWVAALVWASSNPVAVSVAPAAPALDLGASAAEKVCPRCAETVKAAALVCRYCSYEFPPAT